MNIQQLIPDPAAWDVLNERAHALSKVDETSKLEAGDSLLTFRLGTGSYRLPATQVREAHPLSAYTPLPAVPPSILGLVNIRGRLITAIDIRPLLSTPTTPPSPGALLLIVGPTGAEVGLLADEVSEVRHLTTDINPSPATNAGRGTAWVRGVDNDLCLHLDLDLMLADRRLQVNHTDA